jgi:ribonuclease HIII
MAPRKKRVQADSLEELNLFSGGAGVPDRDVPPLGESSPHVAVRESGGRCSPSGSVFTRELTADEVEKLRSVLLGRGWALEQRAYMEFFAKRPDVSISLYTKGPKLVVQGKGTGHFLEFILEPEVTGVLLSGRSHGTGDGSTGDEEEGAHIGVDESGKGDFFGPLVVAAVFVDSRAARGLRGLGVMDSKRIGSDEKISVLARGIRSMPGVETDTLVLAPVKYNELYEKFKNLNRMLAWGHARVIENVLERRPDCPRALSDQFAHPSLIKRALMARGRRIIMEQRTKAESDIAVAAASVLARDKFVEWMSDAAARLGMELPKGASGAVKRAGAEVVTRFGATALRDVCKTHFKTASEIAPDFFVKPPLPSGESLH